VSAMGGNLFTCLCFNEMQMQTQAVKYHGRDKPKLVANTG